MTDAFGTVESEDFVVTSSSESAEQLSENLKPPAAEPEPAHPEDLPDDSDRLRQAASELGKAGAAKRRGDVEPEEIEAKPEEGQKLGKPRDDPRARMLEATRKEAEAKRAAAAAQQRAEQLERRLAELEQARNAPSSTKERMAQTATDNNVSDPKPKSDDFETWAEYEDARDSWLERKFETKVAERVQQQFDRQRQEAYKRYQDQERQKLVDERASQFSERLAEAKKATPDLMERVHPGLLQLVPASMVPDQRMVQPINLIAEVITSGEYGPALLLHFTDHPEDFQRIATLPSHADIVRETANLGMRLGAAPQATAPKAGISRAHDPVRPVAGVSIAASPLPNDEDSFEEHVRKMDSREARGR